MASKWELVLWLLALPPSRSIVFKDQLFPYPTQHHSPHALCPLPEATLKMAAPLSGIKGGKKSKQVSISEPLPCARDFLHSFLIYFCEMKGVVLAGHLARLSPVQAVFFSY